MSARKGSQNRAPRGMGSVARKGAAKVLEEPLPSGPDPRSEEPPEESPEEAEEARLRAERRAARQARNQELRAEAREAVSRSGLSDKPKRPAPKASPARKRAPRRQAAKAQKLEEAVGPQNAHRLRRDLEQAEAAYGQGDYRRAWRLLEPLAKDAPNVAEVRELAGLTLYRLGRWGQATTELEAYRELTGRTDLHPVLADCHRARQRWADVDELWAELRASEPSAAVLAEGRIVAAGALGDRGELKEAVRLLSGSFHLPRRAKEHHMRQAYALADLCERAGEIPRARELFAWICDQDELYVDAVERLAALR